MARLRSRAAQADAGPTGNFIAEWFGYRVWPSVNASAPAKRDQPIRVCPFLSSAKRETTRCTKTARGYDEPTGMCTVSSDSNGVREDWLACSIRILDQHFTLLGGAIRTLYQVPPAQNIVLFPVPVLSNPHRKREIRQALNQGTRVFVFSADKLGGEVDVPETGYSPGLKVDNSVIEITAIDPATGEPSEYGRHMFFEIQTTDFHGSPLHAVRRLREKCQQGTTELYHDRIEGALHDCGEGMEGPNKANVFKRTSYQMIFKIELDDAALSAGFAIVLPIPVWKSWLKHVGQPELIADRTAPAVFHLKPPSIEEAWQPTGQPRSWIFVFDIDRESPESPAPLKILYRIAVTSETLSAYAFKVAPMKAIEHGAIDAFRKNLIAQRVLKNWKAAIKPRRGKPKGRKAGGGQIIVP